MAWDFSTEPEFEAQLEWMRGFVREAIWPIETIQHEISQPELDQIYAPLQQRVREQFNVDMSFDSLSIAICNLRLSISPSSLRESNFSFTISFPAIGATGPAFAASEIR